MHVFPNPVTYVCYVLDDILIIRKTFEEHLENIARVLDRLHEAELKLKPSMQESLFIETSSVSGTHHF